jgi:predicted dinucleotide-binding enzyme
VTDQTLPRADLPRIAVLGAGHVGPVIARVAVEAGYEVSLAASGNPDAITLISQVLAPGAEARWATDAVKDSDIVILSIPLRKFATFDAALVAGKLVIDAMNYWPPTDGVLGMFEGSEQGSSEVVQRRLAGSTVVKTLNHIGYHELDEQRRPAGSPARRALAVASDDVDAVAVVGGVIDRIGYDAVRLSSLSAGRLLQPGGPLFGVPLDRDELEQAVTARAG